MEFRYRITIQALIDKKNNDIVTETICIEQRRFYKETSFGADRLGNSYIRFFYPKETQISKYYDKMLTYGFDLHFIIAFHPYYRTAKFAQRKSENAKALEYYKKAYELYSDDETDAVKLENLGQLCYDLGSVYLSVKDYKKSREFLEKSYRFSPAENPQRSYVLAILCAIEGKKDESKQLVDSLPDNLKVICKQIISSI